MRTTNKKLHLAKGKNFLFTRKQDRRGAKFFRGKREKKGHNRKSKKIRLNHYEDLGQKRGQKFFESPFRKPLIGVKRLELGKKEGLVGKTFKTQKSTY